MVRIDKHYYSVFICRRRRPGFGARLAASFHGELIPVDADVRLTNGQHPQELTLVIQDALSPFQCRPPDWQHHHSVSDRCLGCIFTGQPLEQ
jgi:hypothetical protein